MDWGGLSVRELPHQLLGGQLRHYGGAERDWNVKRDAFRLEVGGVAQRNVESRWTLIETGGNVGGVVAPLLVVRRKK